MHHLFLRRSRARLSKLMRTALCLFVMGCLDLLRPVYLLGPVRRICGCSREKKAAKETLDVFFALFLQVIAGLNNFDAASVAAVVSAAEKVRAGIAIASSSLKQ